MSMTYDYYTPHSTSSTVSYSLRDHLIKEYYTTCDYHYGTKNKKQKSKTVFMFDPENLVID